MKKDLVQTAKTTSAIAARAQSLCAVFLDGKASWKYRLLLVVAVAYIISPLDLIPDPIVILGWLDDVLLAVVTATLIFAKANELYKAIKAKPETPDAAPDTLRHEPSASRERTPQLDQNRHIVDTIGDEVEKIPAVATDKKAKTP